MSFAVRRNGRALSQVAVSPWQSPEPNSMPAKFIIRQARLTRSTELRRLSILLRERHSRNACIGLRGRPLMHR